VGEEYDILLLGVAKDQQRHICKSRIGEDYYIIIPSAADAGSRRRAARSSGARGRRRRSTPCRAAPRWRLRTPSQDHIATAQARASRPAACVIRAPSTDRCCIAIPGGAGTATPRTSSRAQEVGMEGPHTSAQDHAGDVPWGFYPTGAGESRTATPPDPCSSRSGFSAVSKFGRPHFEVWVQPATHHSPRR